MDGDLSVGQVKEALRRFFLKRSRKKVKKCELCVEKIGSSNCGNIGEYPLSEEEVGVVLSALSIPQEETGMNGRDLWMCVECANSLTTLVELFMRLEELRTEFNKLRRKVWKGIILGSLKEKKATWDCWEEELIRLDKVYPSCAFESVKHGNVYLWTVEDERSCITDVDGLNGTKSGLENDAKLSKMRPVVVLERLQENLISESCGNQTSKVKNEQISESFFVATNPSKHGKDLEEILAPQNVEIKDETSSDENSGDDYEITSNDLFVEDDEEKEDRENFTTPEKYCDIAQQNETIQNAVPPKYPPAPVQIHLCSLCDLTFTRRCDMFRHIEDVHEKPDSEEEQEDVHAEDQEEKEERNILSSPEKPPGISRQNETLPTLVLVQPLTAVPAPVQIHPCSQCNLTFTRRYDMFRHIEEVHEKPDSEEEEEDRQRHFHCPSCPKSYFKAPNLWHHKRIKHPELMKRPCPSCPEVFDRDWKLLEHRKETHNFTPPPLLSKSRQCPVCSQTFSSAAACRRHVAKIHEKTPSKSFRKCPRCPASFRHPNWLRRHFYFVHPEIHLKKKPNPCLVCFHSFRSAGDLESHMERHASLKCPTCSKYLPTTVHLRKHLKTHQKR